MLKETRIVTDKTWTRTVRKREHTLSQTKCVVTPCHRSYQSVIVNTMSLHNCCPVSCKCKPKSGALSPLKVCRSALRSLQEKRWEPLRNEMTFIIWCQNVCHLMRTASVIVMWLQHLRYLEVTIFIFCIIFYGILDTVYFFISFYLFFFCCFRLIL